MRVDQGGSMKGLKFKPCSDWVNHTNSQTGENQAMLNFTSLSLNSSNDVQPADIGWPTGNGKTLSCRQAQLGQATGLALA